VVEDNFLIAQAISDIVVEQGYQFVGPVGHVESGVKCVCEESVDAAVVDINLHSELSNLRAACVSRHPVLFPRWL